MIDGPITQVVAGIISGIGIIVLTLLGLRGRNTSEEIEERQNIVKDTENLTNRIAHLENRLQTQATEFGSRENDLEERISKLENSLNQSRALLDEKDKSLEESRSVNSIMAQNANNMSNRMAKLETQMEDLQKKYEAKVEALTEREKLISELETQLKIQQVSIELLKDVGTRPIVIHLVNGDRETTHKVDTTESLAFKKEQKPKNKTEAKDE